jgi:type II secretory ATPase GspE/PulE/Tfp pilus assembly ATPase PilB-like protein
MLDESRDQEIKLFSERTGGVEAESQQPSHNPVTHLKMENKVYSLKLSNESDELKMLKSEVVYRTRLQEIGNKVFAASNLDEIFFDLKDEITSLFEAERITLYVVDGIRRLLVSRFKSGDEIEEISLPVSTGSIAGFCAVKRKMININNVYDRDELLRIDPLLMFDKSWDIKTGFHTRQVLAAPTIHKQFLLGVIQLINRKSNVPFTSDDERALIELSNIMGISLWNQKRIAVKTRMTKFDCLLENHLISQKDLDKAVSDARQRRESVENILMQDFKIPRIEILKSLGRFFNVPYVEYNEKMTISRELVEGLQKKIAFMQKNRWVPLRKDSQGKVVIAIDNPKDIQKADEIKKSFFLGKEVSLCVALKDDILKMIDLFTRDQKNPGEINEILSRLEEESCEISEEDTAPDESDSAVVQLVNKIILDAHGKRASDIHIEPQPGRQNTKVRVRVDGSCMLYQTIPYNFQNAVVSRVKIMSNLDIAERRKPQDGKIKFRKFGGKDIELRVATIPTSSGSEDIVMRILAEGDPIALEKIGFSERNYEKFLEVIQKPYGIIFVCGPTGSGKTTTLHSALAKINTVETKIWTAEDPVEITQPGLRQVQVRPKIGFGFAAAMRSFLRADPDVIMIGEMRDKETTQMGIEASLTGHLVFSTLHTNSAPESVTRLLDMGMDPFNFADAVLAILAQRLVRTLCKDCKRVYHPSRKEYDELVREYGAEHFDRNVKIAYDDELRLCLPVGCSACSNTGYRGRMGIHELLIGTDSIKQRIQSRAPIDEIRKQAIIDGMTTLKQDGIEKVFQGAIDLRQVRKVCIK